MTVGIPACHDSFTPLIQARMGADTPSGFSMVVKNGGAQRRRYDVVQIWSRWSGFRPSTFEKIGPFRNHLYEFCSFLLSNRTLSVMSAACLEFSGHFRYICCWSSYFSKMSHKTEANGLCKEETFSASRLLNTTILFEHLGFVFNQLSTCQVKINDD